MRVCTRAGSHQRWRTRVGIKADLILAAEYTEHVGILDSVMAMHNKLRAISMIGSARLGEVAVAQGPHL